MSETQLEPTESHGRRNPLLWPVRFLLHWIVKLVVVIALAIGFILRPRIVRYGLVALAIAGFFGWKFWGQELSNRGIALAGSQPSSPAASQAASTGATKVSMPTTEQIAAAPVVEQYLKAQSRFDAYGMWDVISDDLKQQLASSNTTVADLQQQLDSAKNAGRKYGQATYVAGSHLDQGANAYFYVLDIDTPNGTMKVPYVYVVGGDGKIASIQ